MAGWATAIGAPVTVPAVCGVLLSLETCSEEWVKPRREEWLRKAQKALFTSLQ